MLSRIAPAARAGACGVRALLGPALTRRQACPSCVACSFALRWQRLAPQRSPPLPPSLCKSPPCFFRYQKELRLGPSCGYGGGNLLQHMKRMGWHQQFAFSDIQPLTNAGRAQPDVCEGHAPCAFLRHNSVSHPDAAALLLQSPGNVFPRQSLHAASHKKITCTASRCALTAVRHRPCMLPCG